MLIQLDPFVVDVEDELERSFVKWYDVNKECTKEVVLQGFAAVHLGVSKLFERRGGGDDGGWKSRFEQLQGAVDVSIKDAVAASCSSMQAQLANKNAEVVGLRASYESQLASLKQTVDALKAQQGEQVDSVRAAYECMVGSLKDELEVAKRAFKDQLESVRSMHVKELELKTQAAFKELELKNRELADAEVKMGLLVDKARAEALAEMASKQVEMNKFELLYVEAEKKLQAALEGTLLRSQECVIAGLQRDLKNKEDELAVLKKTNFGRGVVGETMVVDFLRRTYCDACVEDKSHVKHSCDVWMTLGNGDYFAFECKFKDTINSKGDIDKFYNDVTSMSRDAKFLGGVFVSCKTCNIPGKGALCVEVFNDRPLLFVGFDGDDGFDAGWLKQCMVILFQLAQHQKSLVGKSSSIQDVVKKLVPLLDKIKKLRGSIDKIRKVHLTQVLSLTDDMDKELACMFEEILGVTGNQSGGGGVMFHCEKCNQAFKTKVALGKHVKGCGI